MLSDIKEVADRMEKLGWYLEFHRDSYKSVDEAFLAGYRKAIEDTIVILKEAQGRGKIITKK